MRFAVAGMLVFLAFAPAGAADFAKTGPQADAAEIRAARGPLTEPALKLAFTVEDNVTAPHAMIVESAPDFLYVEEAGRGTIYDYRIRRIVELDSARHVFNNDSLYAIVDFAVLETANRRFQRDTLAATKAPDQAVMLDPFWVQSELHVIDPADPAALLDRTTSAGGAAYFSSHDKPAASFSLSGQALSADERIGFARFLRMRAAIHPKIADALVASGKLPQRLSFVMPPMMKKPDVTWTLKSVERTRVPYPLLTAYSPELLPVGSKDPAILALQALLPTMLAATRNAKGARSIADYRAAINGALQKRQPFQAVLLGLELTLQYGKQAGDCPPRAPAGCHSLKEIFAAAASDPRAQDLKRALAAAPAQAGEAATLLQTMKRDDVSDSYVVDAFLANNLSGAGKLGEAFPLLLGAIKANPYVAGYYKDLGDLFRKAFQPDLAWLCYDLGRALPGGAGAPVISNVGDYETKLAAQHPEFF